MLVLKRKEFTKAATKAANLGLPGFVERARHKNQLVDPSYRYGAPSYGKMMQSKVTEVQINKRAQLKAAGVTNPRLSEAITTGKGTIASDSYLNKPIQDRLKEFKMRNAEYRDYYGKDFKPQLNTVDIRHNW